MSPLVSVIIPCYNGEKHISRSIASVYEQNYPRIELIIVDDGSTDKSSEIILGWKERIENKGYLFIYIYQNNRGPGGAIDTGLKYVTGEYITLLDADDRFLMESVKMRANLLSNNLDFDAVRSNGWKICGTKKWLFVQDEQEKKKDIFPMLVEGTTNNWAGSYMIRAKRLWEIYPERKIYPSRFGQNLQLLMPVVLSSGCLFIDEPLMEYIQQPDSMTQTSDYAFKIEKELKNTYNYYIIRKEILENVLGFDSDDQYCLLAKAAYHRSVMQIGLSSNNRRIATEGYQHLLDMNMATIDDIINFYQHYNTYLWYTYRAKKMAKKIKDKIRKLILN